MRTKFLLSLLFFICFGTSTAFAVSYTASGAIATKSTSPNYYADMWYRASAERNAIYREVYRLAENAIKEKVQQQHLKPHHWGVILDIDETTLDNSLWNYQTDIQGSKEDWNHFAAKSISIALPGVKQFARDIHRMGGYVNYVSNRPAFLLAATKKNFYSQGIYFDQILLDTTNVGTSFVNKNPRFNAIIYGQAPSKLPPQKILAWFGDNIQDFPQLKQKVMIKQNPNGPAYQPFGITFFAMPNPMYGSWEANTFH